MVQPDIFVVDITEARALQWSAMRHLLLAVEMLSPSSTRADRFTKRRLYQEQRIPLYWVVNGDDRVVEIWTPDTQFPTFEREELRWHSAGAAEPFVMKLQELFQPL